MDESSIDDVVAAVVETGLAQDAYKMKRHLGKELKQREPMNHFSHILLRRLLEL